MSLKTQHKPKRDGRKTRELADIKRENGQLKRSIARLQKELGRTDEAGLEVADILNELGEPEKALCENCGSKDLAYIETPNKSFLFCKNCRNCIKDLTAA